MCFGILLVCYTIPTISQNISSAAEFSFKAFSICVLVFCIVVFIVSKKWYVSLISAAILESPLLYINFKNPMLLTGKFGSFVKIFDVFGRLDTFTNGVFDITVVVYYLSIAALFICLTVQSENTRRWR